MAQQIRLAICGLAELARHGAGRQQAPDPTGRTTGHDQQRGRADPRRTGWHCGTVVCTWPAMRSACRGPVTVRTWPSFGSGAAEGGTGRKPHARPDCCPAAGDAGGLLSGNDRGDVSLGARCPARDRWPVTDGFAVPASVDLLDVDTGVLERGVDFFLGAGALDWEGAESERTAG